MCWEGISMVPVYHSILSPQRPLYIYMRPHTSGECSEILYSHQNWGEGGSILWPIVSDGVKGICTLKSRFNAGSQNCYYRKLPEIKVLCSAPAFIQPMLPVKSLGSLCKQELKILPLKTWEIYPHTICNSLVSFTSSRVTCYIVPVQLLQSAQGLIN